MIKVVEFGPKFWKKFAMQYKAKIPFCPAEVLESAWYDAPRPMNSKVKAAKPIFWIGMRPHLSMKKKVA